MVRFELKKIFAKSSNKIALIILLVAVVVISYFAIGSIEYVDSSGNSHTGITAYNRLKEVKNIKIYGPQNENDIVGVISFNIGNINAEKVVYNLDIKHNIMLRAGLHCSPNAHELIGTKDIGTVRVGIGYFNEFNDIDKLVYALNDIQNS